MKQNYLQRYPFILDERYANVCNIIEHSYNINGKNDKKSPVIKITKEAPCRYKQLCFRNVLLGM